MKNTHDLLSKSQGKYKFGMVKRANPPAGYI